MDKIKMCYPDWKRKAFTTSYDDGVEQDIKMISLMKKYGIKGTFNLNSVHLLAEEHSYEPGTIHRRMGRRAALEAYSDSGMEIAVHAFTHPFLEKMPNERVAYEIIKDREELEKLFGGVIRGMAYPYGTYSDSVVDVIKNCGIVYSRTVVSTKGFELPTDWLRMPATCHHNNPNVFDIAEKFLQQNEKTYKKVEPSLFYLWGHTYEFEANDNWDRIEKIFETVGGKDDIWYATNIEIYDYVEAFRALRHSVNGDYIYNPTCQTLFLLTSNKKVVLRPGETCNISAEQ